MSAVNTYKVTYCFSQGVKNTSQVYVDYVQAADNKYDTLKAVLSSNSKLRPGTLVIEAVQEVGHGDNVLA